MKRAVIRAEGVLELEGVTLPEVPARGSVRLEPIAIGICGSDLHVLAGHHPFVTDPVYPGHEVLARVSQLGEAVDPDWSDQRVVLEPSLYCGDCAACRRGDYNICEELKVMGFQVPGGMAGAFDAPVDRLHRVPDALPDDAAVLAEPLAVATHAVRLAGPAGRAAVVGAGTIGLLCAIALNHAGSSVTVFDPDERRRRLAAELGFATGEAPAEREFDLAFECVGVQAALRSAISSVRKGGTVLVVGVHGSDPAIQAGLVQDFELRLQGSLMYTSEDYRSAFELLEAFDTSRLLSDRYPLEQLAAAFERAAAGGDTIKVLLTP